MKVNTFYKTKINISITNDKKDYGIFPVTKILRSTDMFLVLEVEENSYSRFMLGIQKELAIKLLTKNTIGWIRIWEESASRYFTEI